MLEDQKHIDTTFDGFDTGKPTGTLKIRQTTKMTENGDSYAGSSDYTYFDRTGKVVLTGPFTITAKRIVVEAPAQ